MRKNIYVISWVNENVDNWGQDDLFFTDLKVAYNRAKELNNNKKRMTSFKKIQEQIEKENSVKLFIDNSNTIYLDKKELIFN